MQEESLSIEDIETFIIDPIDVQSKPLLIETVTGNDENKITNYSFIINNIYDKKRFLLKIIDEVYIVDGKEEKYVNNVSEILLEEIKELSSNSYLWLISIPVVLVVLVIILCIVKKKRRLKGNIANSVMMTNSIKFLEQK